jgi:hypothetical protein
MTCADTPTVSVCSDLLIFTGQSFVTSQSVDLAKELTHNGTRTR